MDYECRFLARDDWAAVWEFFRRVWPEGAIQRDPRRFEWLYAKNPNLPADRSGMIGCYSRNSAAVLVGFRGTIPVKVKVNGRTYLGSWGIDLMVDPQFRRQGIGERLQRFWFDQYPFCLSAGQSPANRSLYSKLEAREIGQTRVYVKALSPTPLQQRFGVFLGRIGWWTLRTYTILRHGLAAVDTKAIHCTVGDRFTGDLDGFWQKIAQDLGNGTVLDSAYLRWRFEEHPYFRWQIIEAYDDHGGYRGFAVVRIDAERREGVVVGMLTHASDSPVRSALLRTAEALCHEHGAESIRCRVLARPIEENLVQEGYVERPCSGALIVAGSQAGSLPQNPDWYLTAADSDQDR